MLQNIIFKILSIVQVDIYVIMLRMFTLFNICPKIPSQEFLACKMFRVHKFTDAKGVINDTEVGLLKFDKKAGL